MDGTIATFLIQDGVINGSIYALLAGQLGGWLKQSQTFQQRQRYFSGSVYIALGVATAVSGSKTK